MLVAVIKETDTLVMSQSRLDRFSQLPAFQGVLSTIYHTDNTAYIFNGNLDCITIMITRLNKQRFSMSKLQFSGRKRSVSCQLASVYPVGPMTSTHMSTRK